MYIDVFEWRRKISTASYCLVEHSLNYRKYMADSEGRLIFDIERKK